MNIEPAAQNQTVWGSPFAPSVQKGDIAHSQLYEQIHGYYEIVQQLTALSIFLSFIESMRALSVQRRNRHHVEKKHWAELEAQRQAALELAARRAYLAEHIPPGY